MTYYEQRYGNMMADDFMFNWSKKPIVDIVAVDEPTCPHGYEPLLEDDWPGTKAGCFCAKEDKLIGDKCNNMVDNLIEFFKGDDNCVDVRPMSPVPFIYIFGKNICGKRQGDSFVESVRPKHNLCPENY